MRWGKGRRSNESLITRYPQEHAVYNTHTHTHTHTHSEVSASTESNGNIILLLRSGLNSSPQDVRKPIIAAKRKDKYIMYTKQYDYTK